MNFIDLFAGVGGFHYGLTRASKKFKCVWANEWDKYAGQIYQKRFSETPFNANRIRRLTPVECERLQGFPDNWTEELSDTQRYKCMGNAVTTNVVQAIGEKMIKKW